MKSGSNKLHKARINPMQSSLEFLCVGAQKAGTTWLDRCLRKHPQLYLPPIKEIHFWDSYYSLGSASPEKFKVKAINRLQRVIKHGGIDDHHKLSELLFFLSKIGYTDLTPDLYNKLFPVKFDGLRGEITPEYALLNSDQWRNIRNVVPEHTKILFIMRNPVQRAWSGCRMYMRNILKIDITQLEEEELVGLLLKKHAGWLGVSDLRTNYIETCRVLDECFHHRLYLSFDHICLEPKSVLKKICNFFQIEYNQKYFAAESSKRTHSDPNPLEMPIEINEFLLERYSKQAKFVNSLFGPEECLL